MNFKESDGERYRENEEVKICPFDESHRLLPHRFAHHLIRCEKNHPHIKLTPCLYNNTHRVRESRMDAHLLVCEDKAVADREDIFHGKDPLAAVRDAAAKAAACEAASQDSWEPIEVLSPTVWSPGTLSPTARYSYAEGEHFEDDYSWYSVGSSGTSSPLRAGASDSLITHASCSPSTHSKSTGDKNVTSPGSFSYFSRSQFSPRSNSPRSDLPIPLANKRKTPVQSAQTESFWSLKPVASASGQATNWIPSDYGAHAGGAVSVTRKGSAAASSIEVSKKVTPAEKKYIIRRKRFLEKKIHGIEKLERKMSAGQTLTEEEKIKIEKKDEFEEDLAALIEGINLDD